MAKPATATKAPVKPNFASLLSKPGSEVERPVPLPVGSYVCVVQGLPRFDKSSQKQTDFVEFTLKVTEARDDVDEDELEKSGGLADKTIKATYYITETALWRLKDFLSACGLEADGDKTLEELIEETPNATVGIFIRHEPGNDGQSMFARVGKAFAVE